MMPTHVRQELQKLNAFGACWMFLPVIPILVPYQLELGLNMQQVFWVQVFFGLVCALFEVPSGYLADVCGRKGLLLIGSLLWALGFAWLYLGVHDFWGMLIYEGLLGLAVSLVSGADLALLYDWQHSAEGGREAGTQALANYQWAQVLSEALAGLVCGLLVLQSFRAVLACQACVALAPVVMACTLREPAYQKLSTDNHWQNLQTVWRHVFVADVCLRLIFLNQILWSLATFVMVWLNQKIWQVAGLPLAVFGILWTLINLLVGLTGRQVVRLEKRHGSEILLISLGLLPIMGYALSALAHGWLLILAGCLFPISRGITQILLKDAINWRTPAAIRATVLSLNSLLFRLGFALLGPLTGWATDHLGLRITLWGLAGLFSLGFICALRPLLREVSALSRRSPVA